MSVFLDSTFHLSFLSLSQSVIYPSNEYDFFLFRIVPSPFYPLQWILILNLQPASLQSASPATPRQTSLAWAANDTTLHLSSPATTRVVEASSLITYLAPNANSALRNVLHVQTPAFCALPVLHRFSLTPLHAWTAVLTVSSPLLMLIPLLLQRFPVTIARSVPLNARPAPFLPRTALSVHRTTSA